MGKYASFTQNDSARIPLIDTVYENSPRPTPSALKYKRDDEKIKFVTEVNFLVSEVTDFDLRMLFRSDFLACHKSGSSFKNVYFEMIYSICRILKSRNSIVLNIIFGSDLPPSFPFSYLPPFSTCGAEKKEPTYNTFF